MGADLSDANLLNASLVHADLTQSNLIHADWIGADLTGAILTGAKLHAVSRFGIKTDSMTCEWIDLSPNGDKRQIYRFYNAEEARKFFNQTFPTLRITVDSVLDQDANVSLANIYREIAQHTPSIPQPPSVEVGYRRTVITFKVDNDDQLLLTAYVAILPFKDAAIAQENITALVSMGQTQDRKKLNIKELKCIKRLSVDLAATVEQIKAIRLAEANKDKIKANKFFQAPTQIILTNSSDQSLEVYLSPSFGKRFVNPPGFIVPITDMAIKPRKFTLPSINIIAEFIKGFHELDAEIDSLASSQVNSQTNSQLNTSQLDA